MHPNTAENPSKSLAERVADLQAVLASPSEEREPAFQLNELGVAQNTQSVVDFNDWAEWSSHW